MGFSSPQDTTQEDPTLPRGLDIPLHSPNKRTYMVWNQLRPAMGPTGNHQQQISSNSTEPSIFGVHMVCIFPLTWLAPSIQETLQFPALCSWQSNASPEASTLSILETTLHPHTLRYFSLRASCRCKAPELTWGSSQHQIYDVHYKNHIRKDQWECGKMMWISTAVNLLPWKTTPCLPIAMRRRLSNSSRGSQESQGSRGLRGVRVSREPQIRRSAGGFEPSKMLVFHNENHGFWMILTTILTGFPWVSQSKWLRQEVE